jgi:hypothetical protein
MTGKPLQNRRKQFIINREIQIGITARFVFIFILFIVISTGVVFFPSALRLISGSTVEELSGPAHEFLILHKRIWPMVLLVISGTVVYSIFLTHRLAGPVYRLNKELKNMIEGNYPEKIILREKDFFKETASLLETLSNNLRNSERGLGDMGIIMGKIMSLKEEASRIQGGDRIVRELESIEKIVSHKYEKVSQ